MDNFTHAFAGMAIAEGLNQYQVKRSRSWGKLHRTSLYWLATLVSNFPDIDFIWTGVTGGKIGYLLHHRGFSHSLGGFLIELPIIMGMFWVASRFLKSLRVMFERSHTKLFWGAALFCLGVHVFMDSWNEYGVHPFWPFSMGWMHGDSVFIFEPWIWLISLCAFWGFLRTKWTRAGFIGLCFLSLYLVWGIARFDWKGSLFYTLMYPAIYWVFTRIKSDFHRVLTAVTLSLALVSCLFVMSRQIQAGFFERDSSHNSEHRLVEVIVSAMPSNPLCWITTRVDQTRDGLGYFITRGFHTVWPDFISAKKCNVVPLVEVTTPSIVLNEEDPRSNTFWVDRYEGSRSRLLALNQQDCHTNAFLRFSRAPVVLEKEDRRTFIDMRYDREKGYGFAEYDVLSGAGCPKLFPLWEPPLKGFLR